MVSQFLKVALCASLFLLPVAFADVASVKKAVDAHIKSDEIRKLPELDLYEVRVGNDIFYTDEKVSFFVEGSIIDTKTRKNLTLIRQNELSAVKFSDLPLEAAVKNVRGKGTRVIATFEDPNCGYCRELAKELVKVDDLTVYTFLLPILRADSTTKSDAIWCSADRGKAWTDLMLNNKSPAPAPKNCAAPTAKVKELGQKFRISGTPTIFLSNGERIPGFVPAQKLEELLKTAAAK